MRGYSAPVGVNLRGWYFPYMGASFVPPDKKGGERMDWAGELLYYVIVGGAIVLFIGIILNIFSR